MSPRSPYLPPQCKHGYAEPLCTHCRDEVIAALRAENERLANIRPTLVTQEVSKLIEDAVASERERCINIARNEAPQTPGESAVEAGWNSACQWIAGRIEGGD